MKTGFDLLRKLVRIACVAKHFLRCFPSHLVIAVAVAQAANEDRCYNQRTGHAGHSNGVREHAIVRPGLITLFFRLREPMIDDSCEILLHSGCLF